MLRLNLLQNQWLFLALLGGLAVMALVMLAYIAVWRRRDVSEQASHEYGVGRFYLPWVLIVIIAGTTIWGLVYTYMAVRNPPNW